MIAFAEPLDVARVRFGVAADPVDEDQLFRVLLAGLDGTRFILASAVADLGTE